MTPRLLIAAALAFLMASCASSGPAEGQAATTGPGAATPEAELPAAWPRCPEWEKLHGPARGPDLWLTGRQALVYTKPGKRGDSIRIIYEGQRKPRIIRNYDGTSADQGTISILGQEVGYYSSGNEEAEISTQALLLTSPSGWSGWFSFDFSSPEHLQGKNIPAFAW